MPYRYPRDCELCGKTGLKNITSHMKYAHSDIEQSTDSTFSQTVIRPVASECQLVNSTISTRPSCRSTLPQQQKISTLILLQQYSILPYLKKIEYIKERAPDNAVEIFRLLIVNTLYGNILISDTCQKKLLDLDCEWLYCKMLDNNITPKRARRLLTCPKLIRFIDHVMPYAIRQLN